MNRFRVNIFRQRGTYRDRHARHPAAAAALRGLQSADAAAPRLSIEERHRAGHRSDRQRQEFDAGGDHRSDQRDQVLSHRHIEDPIEFLHTHKNSTIHQRELHSDTPNFALALRAALRQAPKVILVGEMRDRETMEVALRRRRPATWCSRRCTRSTPSKTVERIIGAFPKNEEQIIRTRLAQSFRYIISQRLLPRADGNGRVAAIEILKATSRTREYIEHGETEGKSLLDAMEQGEIEGMQTFDSQIEKMIRSGVISKDDGLAYASNQGNMLLRLGEFGHTEHQRPSPSPNQRPTQCWI